MNDAEKSEAATHSEHEHHDHHGPDFSLYMKVFAALAVFTAASFGVNAIFGLGSGTGMAIIMLIAVVKALLVATIFMHLKWDWSHLYFMVIPAFIIAVMMIIVFMPDIVLAW